MKMVCSILLVVICFAGAGVFGDAAGAESIKTTVDKIFDASSTKERAEALRKWIREMGEEPVDDDLWKQYLEQAKTEYDDRAWSWFDESTGGGTALLLRETHPEFPAYHLAWVRSVMQMDADTTTTSGQSGATADELALSVWRQIVQRSIVDNVTAAEVAFIPEYNLHPRHFVGAMNLLAWTRFAGILGPHESVRGSFGQYGTLDILQAVFAVSDNRLAMATHHLDGHNLLNMAGYQVAQRLMLDTMMEVIASCVSVESCAESAVCQALAEAGNETCAVTGDFCRASTSADEVGICTGLPQRCRHALDCVYDTSRGLGSAENCIVESWEALRSGDASSIDLPTTSSSL